MNESPKSSNIRLYYKGYSIQLTLRNEKEKVFPLLEKMIKVADYAEKKGFKPSWNEDTNKQVSSKTPIERAACNHDNTEVRIANIEKNRGKKYKRCNDCNAFIGWV